MFGTFAEQLPLVLGPWPTALHVGKAFLYLVQRIPYLRNIPIPQISVSHTHTMLHISDQRGHLVGWHELDAPILCRFLEHMLSETFSNYAVGGIVAQAYHRLDKAITRANQHHQPWIVFNRMVALDSLLAASLVMSPSYLLKMERWFNDQEGWASMVTSLETTVPDALVRMTVIRRAMSGYKVHLNLNDIENSVCKVHSQILAYLDGAEDGEELRKAVMKHFSDITEKKEEYIFFEKRTLSCSEYRWLNERNFNTFSKSRGFIYDCTLPLTTFFQNFGKALESERAREILFFVWKVWNNFMTSLQTCFLLILGWATFKNLLFLATKALIRYHCGEYFSRVLWTFLVMTIALCVSIMANLRTAKGSSKLQGGEKQITALMAFLVLVIHLFDVDLAMALSRSLSGINQLTNMLGDQTRNLLPRMIGTKLQMSVEEIHEITMELDKEEEHTLDFGRKLLTFGGWIDSKEMNLETYTRELQYGGQGVQFHLNRENAENLAQEMVETKRAWNSVMGVTGSGKSTRLPVIYNTHLKNFPERKQRILVCEPSRATTANVAAGISNFFGQQVHYKHRTKDQPGSMAIQVMTYGSALMRSLREPGFLQQFDAVFLDESHSVSSHSLTLEALLDRHGNIRKFYMSATPRVGPLESTASRRFNIVDVHVDNTDPNYFLKEQGSGSAYDVLDKGPVILCFVQGRNQADKLSAKIDSGKYQGYRGISLHSGNFDTNYSRVIQATNNGDKVFVFCTNILETGVTLNADCVVDFGFTMRPQLNVIEKCLTLVSSRVTEFERIQRKGRVGRVKDGYAILCGKTVKGRPPVAPEVVYEAALYSFIYDLDLYSNEFLDTHWLSTITKPQAETMLKFDLPCFLLRELVFKDGSMRPEMISFLKANLLSDESLVAREGAVTQDRWQSWPSANDLILTCLRGEENDDLRSLAREKIPFSCFQLFDQDLPNFISACKLYKPTTLEKSLSLGKVSKKVIMRVDPENVNRCYTIAVALREHLKNMLDSLQITRSKVSESTLISCFTNTKRLLADHDKRIDVMRKNIRTVNDHISNLETYESFISGLGDDDLLGNFDFFRVSRHVSLQMDGQNNKEELMQILGIDRESEIGVKDVLLHHGDKIALAMLAASGAYMISQIYGMFQTDDSFTTILEGKGKVYNRDKRSEAAAVNEAFDMVENLRQKKRRQPRKERPDVISNLLKKTNPFVNFYDLGNGENVEEAVFRTLDGEKILSVDNPVAALDTKEIHNFIIENLTDDKGHTEDAVCDVKLRDGKEVKIRLSPHQPRQITRTGGLAGYPDHSGELRQTGSATFTKLEMASAIPATNLDLGISKMVGVIYRDGLPLMNVLLYGDFIICPAHVQLTDGSFTVRFEHGMAPISKDHMKFQQCDYVLFRRPNSLMPIKLMAKASTIERATHVQLVYRDHKSFSAKISASDLAQPFMNGRFSYSISTKDGMCGAAVANLETGTIVGIHVSANENLKRNFMEPFSHDFVDVLQKKIPFSSVEKWNFVSTDCGYLDGEVAQSYEWALSASLDRYTIDNMNRTASGFGHITNFHKVSDADRPVTFSLSNGGFEVLGKSTSNLCSKHKIVGENVYWKEFKKLNPELTQGIEEFEDAYCPSALNREAYYKDVSKYDRGLKAHFHIPTMEKARKMVLDDLEQAGLQSTRKKSATEVLADLEVNTAAGALYACKKKILFAGWDDAKVLSFANDCYKNLVDGTNVGVWNGSLKDELRPVEKVEENKTRVFTASTITTLLGGKFVVDDFNTKFYATNLHARHTVGINPWAGGWGKLKSFLEGPEIKHFVSGDGSRFDSSIDPILFDQVLKIRLALIGNENGEHDALKNLYHEIVFTPILLENGQIVMKKVGNNSGQPSTVVDNTLILMMCFYYCALRKRDDPAWIRENFKFVCNGDDQKCGFTDEFIQNGCFDFENMLGECGLNYEFDDITDDITKYPYMSLTMVENRGRIGFSLDPTRIVAINQWMTKKGVLGVAQRAFPAMLHSYNDPWLFTINHAFLVWLLLTYEDEIIWQMRQSGEQVSYLDPDMVDFLHFGGTKLQGDGVDDTEKNEKKDKKDDLNPETAIITGTQTWSMPSFKNNEKARGFRKLKGAHIITVGTIKSTPSGVRSLMRNDVATNTQFNEWCDRIREDLEIKDNKQFETVLAAWILYCAHNGTSDKHDPLSVMQVPTGKGDTMDVQIGPFIRSSQKVGLRRIMRYLSKETKHILENLGEMTKWGLSRGIQGSQMVPYAFDFYVVDEETPIWVRDQLASAKHAALGRGELDTLGVDTKHHSLTQVTRPRNDQTNGASASSYTAPQL